MSAPIYRAGQFTWCRFPFRESPNVPGPVDHVGYILDIFHRVKRDFVAATAYTTTAPWPESLAIPLGVVRITRDRARAVNQEPFVIDLRRIGFLPIDAGFFPQITRNDHGVIGEATLELQRHLEATLAKVLRRPELLELLGPYRPGR